VGAIHTRRITVRAFSRIYIWKLVVPGTLAGLPLAALACGDSPTGDPATGRLVLHAVTTGADVDPDGYTMRVDDQEPVAIGISGSVETAGLTAGNHEVEIGGIASNCQESGSNPLAVSIQAEATTEVTFEVTCAARNGVLQIRTFTSGSGADIDGFVVRVDGSEARSILPTGAVALIVAPGEHEVLLDEVPAVCAVDGANPRAVAVGPDEVEFVTFVIRCEGALEDRR
jgi:hypothetical protein